jgi:hypothetical protein
MDGKSILRRRISYGVKYLLLLLRLLIYFDRTTAHPGRTQIALFPNTRWDNGPQVVGDLLAST